MLARFRRWNALLSVLLATLALGLIPSQLTAGAQTAPSFGFYIDEPFVQTAYYTLSDRSNVQDFNMLSLGAVTSPETWSGISTSSGVTGAWSVVQGDEWGGATTTAPSAFGDPQTDTDEAKRSQYALIAQGNSLAIDLAAQAACLGFWWSGGDPFNQVEFFTTDSSGNQDKVATITTGALTEQLKDSSGLVAGVQVTSLGGPSYNAIGFYGHPVSTGSPVTRRWGPPGTRAAEPPGTVDLYPYLFVHAIAQGGVTFDRVVLSQVGPGNFEFDNLTLSSNCPVKQSLVLIAEVLDSSFAQKFITAQNSVASASQPVPPTLACSPSPVQAGLEVTCEVAGGDPNIEILWSASFGGDPFASQGVRLDASGRGTFTFVAPAAAIGQEVAVELVEWLAPISVSVLGGPIPASIPAGSGSTVPLGLVVIGLLVAAGSLVGIRRQVATD